MNVCHEAVAGVRGDYADAVLFENVDDGLQLPHILKNWGFGFWVLSFEFGG